MLRIWLLLTAAALTGILLWAFAPVLVFLALLTGALGIIAAAMIALARALRAWRGNRDEHREDNALPSTTRNQRPGDRR